MSTPDEELKLHVERSYVYRGDKGVRFINNAEGKTLIEVREAKDGTLAARIVACVAAFEGVDIQDIEAIGHVPEAVERVVQNISAERDQWMQIAALLMHRFALSGETVVIGKDEKAKLDACYPEGADLRAEDAEDGAIAITLLPPGEEPSGIILPPSGPGRLIAS